MKSLENAASSVVIHYKEALYQVYVPLPFNEVDIMDASAPPLTAGQCTIINNTLTLE